MKEKELKVERVLELFFRAIKGEGLSVKRLSDEYQVSTRSITRDINNLKMFLYEHRDLIGYTELEYSSRDHCYTLKMDNLFTNKELLAVTKVLIGSRAFNNEDLLELIQKLKQNTTDSDQRKLENLIRKELYHYTEIGSDCKSVIEHIWRITDCIENKNSITVQYYKMNREIVKHKIKPVSIMFADYYFYLIAFVEDDENSNAPKYFRVDRIIDFTVHREKYELTKEQTVDEGELRRKSQFMWPGEMRKIQFEFSGPSLQAILDKVPTARVVGRKGHIYILEAEVYGTGIKMFLLSQGAWVKVLAPESFVEEMKEEIRKMWEGY